MTDVKAPVDRNVGRSSAEDGVPQRAKIAGTVGSFAGAMIAFRLSYGAWPPSEGHLWQWITADSRAQISFLMGLIGVAIGGIVGRTLAGAGSSPHDDSGPYVNARFGFSLRIPPGWTRRRLDRQFERTGGQLVIWSPDRQRQKANLNVVVGPADDIETRDKARRAAKLAATSGADARVDAALTIGGEANAVRADWSDVKQVFERSLPVEGGLLSVVHEGNEYVVQWA